MLVAVNSYSQKMIPLYEGKAPGSEDWDYEEIWFKVDDWGGEKLTRNVVDPTLEVFMPEISQTTGTAVIVCPGGGNHYLEYEKEGTVVAEWLANKGITAFVLKYRVHKTLETNEDFVKWYDDRMNRPRAARESNNPTVPQLPARNFGGEDGIKAIEYVRENYNKYGIDPDKVGIMGFSAGAGVTMYVILNSSPEKQPNFAAPIYGRWRIGSEVPENAPPIFIACTANDRVAFSSPDLFKAWREAGKSAELHIYSKGAHGFGMRQTGLPVNTWFDRYYDWLKAEGF